ncbi:MAG: 7-cyano-7-deazaguanine synthase [Clostridiales Family XIII bacterium]|jgi:7-cyano-7-deazaguanine synthase in queuosine biosynthesis|nr:7-cyano-7-deazaguanine synthase [Clostridiales Family XIII bacterium]
MLKEAIPIYILWTGGYDSTFSLIQFLLKTETHIQPLYIHDSERASTSIEIKTMQHLREMIAQKFPHTVGRILPTKYIMIEEIPENREVTERFNLLLQKAHIGSQYDFITRYLVSVGLTNVNLSMERAPDKKNIHVGLSLMLKDSVEAFDDHGMTNYRLIDAYQDAPESIFYIYNFPTAKFTKVDMMNIAKEKGFAEILLSTWFCFNPTKKMQPCGFCNPCRQVRESGLKRHLPGKLQSKVNHIRKGLVKLIQA